MTDFIKHTPGDCPVGPDQVVVARLSDGHELAAMPAKEIDWDCPGDQVIEYRIAGTVH